MRLAPFFPVTHHLVRRRFHVFRLGISFPFVHDGGGNHEQREEFFHGLAPVQIVTPSPSRWQKRPIVRNVPRRSAASVSHPLCANTQTCRRFATACWRGC